ncbi:MAG: apolipoprotein N-acyltransferase [Treponema sp.]|nr:apolipoprotein N-acyltransferase [Treponema sp.]
MKRDKEKNHKVIQQNLLNQERSDNWYKIIIKNLGLVFLASLLFSASFPNLVIENGIPFFAWFAYIPILIVIGKCSLLACIGWGAVYGFLSYGLFNYWLGTFHPMAGTIVYSVYLFYLAVVFLFFKLADILFPKRSYLVQWFIWLAYEYLCTQGFLGYSYGVTGYSQWRIIPLIQIAGITGVWGVCALVTFPSFWLAGAFKERGTDAKGLNLQQTTQTSASSLSNLFSIIRDVLYRFVKNKLSVFLRKETVSAIIWAIALAAAFTFGFITNKDFSSYPSANITLIQHNTDPWEASKAPTSMQVHEAYRNDLTILKRLSDEALASRSDTQLVVWPETAFVPRIYWHYTYRDDPESWITVRELLNYLSAQSIPFLIGNDDARMDSAKNPNSNDKHRIDYNASLLFEKDQITNVYRKLHLVPFTEHFPYEKQLPFMYKALKEADTHFWEKGDEETVFQAQGFTFSTPICFEDTFGYLSRNFIRRGADILVNISNDAWSNSLPAQNQHLSMAVFRAVENRRSMVRSTASGQTCAIDPAGRIIAMAPPFTEAWLNVSVPVMKGETIYTLCGDYTGITFTAIAAALLLFGMVLCIINNLKKVRK